MESKRNKTFVMIFLGPEGTHVAWRGGQRSPKDPTSSQGMPWGRPWLVAPSGVLQPYYKFPNIPKPSEGGGSTKILFRYRKPLSS